MYGFCDMTLTLILLAAMADPLLALLTTLLDLEELQRRRDLPQARNAGGDGWDLERTGFPQTRGGAAETPPRSTLHEAPLETSGGVAQVLEVGAAGGGRVCNDLDDHEAAVARLVADAGEADLAQLEDDVRPDLAPKKGGTEGEG